LGSIIRKYDVGVAVLVVLAILSVCSVLEPSVEDISILSLIVNTLVNFTFYLLTLIVFFNSVNL